MTTLPQTAPIRVPRPIPAGTISLPANPAGPLAMGGGGPAAPAGAGLTPADIWRVVRANLLLIMLMVVAGGISGYFLNAWLLQKFPKYRSTGTVSVQSPSEIPEPGRGAPQVAPDQIAMLQETHTNTITSVDALYADAMSNPATNSNIKKTKWYASFPGDAERKQNLRENLDAGPISRSRLIRVEFTAADPLDAQTVLRELISPYLLREQQKQDATEMKQIALLKDEKIALEFQLDQVIRPQRIDMEKGLGTDGIEITGNWNAKRYQYDRMLQEQSKIRSELSGLNIQKESLDRSLRDGKTPAEVQSMLSRDGRYLQARQRLDDLDIEIDQLLYSHGEGHDIVIRARKRRAAYQNKLDETREELRSDYADTMRTMLENQIASVSANSKSVESEIFQLNNALGKLNELITKYRMLQVKEQRMQEKIDTYEQDIRRVAEFRLKLHWKPIEWQAAPQLPDRPSFPKLLVTMSLAVVGALALSLGIAFLRELTDTTVRSPRDIAKVGQLTLLGYIPHESDDPEAAASGRLPLAIFEAPNSHIAEQFRQIRTRLQYAHALDTTRSILVTSPSANDGKSTVACNLAASLALNGRQILLVDANFRRPQLHGTFKAANDVGFGDVLGDPERLGEAVVQTEVPNLHLMPAGTRPANATELLESQMFADFIEAALDQYDHVIFDSGPLLMVSESVAMAPRVDGVITVVRARGNSRGLLSRLRDELRRVKAEHLGVVLNAVRSQGGGYYGRNIKSYYAYQNG